MKYEAVIFDLFGTLVDIYSVEIHDDSLRKLAEVFNVPFEDIRRVWYETTRDRSLGRVATNRDNLRLICRRLGVEPTDEQIERGAGMRHEYFTLAMRPRQGAIEVITRLKSRGMKTGMISNCSPVTAEVWPETPFRDLFDVAVFSCSVGLRKPDPRIYLLATEQLDVKPENCLYTGDGSGNELTGAEEVGMHAVMIQVDGEDERGIRVADRQEWDGPVISSLKEVLTLVK